MAELLVVESPNKEDLKFRLEIPFTVLLENLNRFSVEKHVNRQLDSHSGFQAFEDQPPFPINEVEVVFLKPGNVRES